MSEAIDSRILKRYEILSQISKGAYGLAWKAIDKKYKQIVAVKKVFNAFYNATDAQKTYREVMFLQDLNGHENIIHLRKVIKAENNKDLYFVYDYMEADLHHVIKVNILEEVHKPYIVYQVLKSLKYIHSAGIVHRSLRPAHILINSACEIKINHFFEACLVSSARENDNDRICDTRWYKAPENLLGCEKYSEAYDMWALGCILGELILGKPIFQGTSSSNQMDRIIRLIGRPRPEDIEAFEARHTTAFLNNLTSFKQASFEEFFPNASEDALDLLKKLLVFNPYDRITAEEALKHKYVEQFSTPEEEIVCEHIMQLPMDENKKNGAKEYKEAIYSYIKQSKERRRKEKENTRNQEFIKSEIATEAEINKQQENSNQMSETPSQKTSKSQGQQSLKNQQNTEAKKKTKTSSQTLQKKNSKINTSSSGGTSQIFFQNVQRKIPAVGQVLTRSNSNLLPKRPTSALKKEWDAGSNKGSS